MKNGDEKCHLQSLMIASSLYADNNAKSERRDWIEEKKAEWEEKQHTHVDNVATNHCVTF